MTIANKQTDRRWIWKPLVKVPAAQLTDDRDWFDIAGVTSLSCWSAPQRKIFHSIYLFIYLERVDGGKSDLVSLGVDQKRGVRREIFSVKWRHRSIKSSHMAANFLLRRPTTPTATSSTFTLGRLIPLPLPPAFIFLSLSLDFHTFRLLFYSFWRWDFSRVQIYIEMHQRHRHHSLLICRAERITTPSIPFFFFFTKRTACGIHTRVLLYGHNRNKLHHYRYNAPDSKKFRYSSIHR